MDQSIERSDVRWRLRVIFLYYASFADRNNYKLLKSQNYRRFLIDSETVTDQSGFAAYDIAFRKIHSTAINHTQFQELIPAISKLVFNSKSRKQAFESYLKDHLEKLYQEILNQSQFGADVAIIQNINIDKKSIILLESVPLRKSYQQYIESTSMHQKNPEQTFEQIHNFLSDFQLSPKLIYKAMTYLIFFYMLRIKENQSRYDIDDFKKLLICIAQLYWRRCESTEGSQQQKIVRVMQQMELSEGFKRMVDKTLKENAIMVSFFRKMTHRVITESDQNLRGSLEKYRLNDSLQKAIPRSAKNQNNSSYFSAKRQRKENYTNFKDLLNNNQDEHINILKQIFAKLCSHGEVGNAKTLKSIKIKRYFQSLNILNSLSQTWVDLKVADLCRSSSSGKIQFPSFLQLLVFVALKLNITTEGLFQYLIDHSISQNPTLSTYSTKAQGVQPSSKLIEQQPKALLIFCEVQKQLQRIFSHYSCNKKKLSFEQLSHLLYDFDVFPTFITKAKLYSLFELHHKNSNQMQKLIGNISIDIHGFINILMSISVEIGQNLTSQQRVIFMLERMQDSIGHRNLSGGKSNNLVGDLRTKYSNIYRSNVKHIPYEQGFQQLMQGYES